MSNPTKALDNQVSLAEYARVIFSHTPSDSVKFKDVLDPAYWANVAIKFKPGCRIEVLAPDLTWYAELVIISCARTWAKVAVVSHVKLTAPDKEIPAADLAKDRKGYKVEFAGQVKQFRVLRLADKTEIKANLPTEDEAWKFVDNHIQALSL